MTPCTRRHPSLCLAHLITLPNEKFEVFVLTEVVKDLLVSMSNGLVDVVKMVDKAKITD